MSKGYEITGEVVEVGALFTKGNFSKREVVIKTPDDKYPQLVKLECTGQAADYVAGADPGDRLTATFDVRGREWQGRVYTNLVAWKVTVEKTKRNQEPEPRQEAAHTPQQGTFAAPDDRTPVQEDEIPF
jgi:hypothetical protein